MSAGVPDLAFIACTAAGTPEQALQLPHYYGLSFSESGADGITFSTQRFNNVYS